MGSKWNKIQLQILKEDYPYYHSPDLVNKIGKTYPAIQKKAQRLKFEKHKGYINRAAIDLGIKKSYDQPNSFSSFICGFTAGEGSFIQARDKRHRFKFKIELADDDEEILKDIHNFFGIGILYKRGPRKIKWKGSVTYCVQDIPSLINVIVPFFDKYGLFSSRKQQQYLVWRKDLFQYVALSKQ
jgi:hypothetical protein